ncbi:MAG: GAF domain-containing protein [Piscinibacter sp.]|uniref:GAF domain-containing sensor histidine kinase n=2 Tax=Piscinibacter TaxID=1114981 RepID=UPI00258C93B7|nr:GAF domain-containing protein [Piscinibacter sp.]MCW5665914.1 GAF domain-containing protein [Piscinibacter sp.]
MTRFNAGWMNARVMVTPRPDTGAAPPVGGGADLFVQLAAGLAEGRDLRGLLDRLLEPMVALAGAQAGAVRLLSDSGERLQLVSEVGLPGTVHRCEATVDRHCGSCGDATDTQRIVWSSDLRACAARGGEAFFGGACLRLLAVPLQRRGRVLGVYNLFFADDVEPPAPVMAMLRSVGELLGLALDNARLEAESLRATVMHERQMMAAEIHDSIAQTLTFVKMRLPLLQDAVAECDEAHALKYLADVRQAVGEAHGSLREIVTHFRKRIDPRGLAHALQALVARFRERSTIELHYANAGLPLSLSEEAQTEVFHIVQEALANIERHSQARHAWLSIAGGPVGFELRVEDDGVGPRPADEQCDEGSHFGIGIMGERAQRVGGEFTIGPRPGGGTRVRLAWNAGAGAAS